MVLVIMLMPMFSRQIPAGPDAEVLDFSNAPWQTGQNMSGEAQVYAHLQYGKGRVSQWHAWRALSLQVSTFMLARVEIVGFQKIVPQSSSG